MNEVWLRSNRRVILIAMTLPGAGLAIGAALIAVSPYRQAWQAWAGYILALLGVSMLLVLAGQLRQPRLAFRPGHLLVFLRGGPPTAVPLEVVEAFFLGRGPSLLPGGQSPQTMNLIVRLAQKETHWRERPVKAALGSWSDGYIIIRGTWCEPLTVELVHDLNHRLAEAKRAQRQSHGSDH